MVQVPAFQLPEVLAVALVASVTELTAVAPSRPESVKPVLPLSVVPSA